MIPILSVNDGMRQAVLLREFIYSQVDQSSYSKKDLPRVSNPNYKPISGLIKVPQSECFKTWTKSNLRRHEFQPLSPDEMKDNFYQSEKTTAQSFYCFSVNSIKNAMESRKAAFAAFSSS